MINQTPDPMFITINSVLHLINIIFTGIVLFYILMRLKRESDKTLKINFLTWAISILVIEIMLILKLVTFGFFQEGLITTEIFMFYQSIIIVLAYVAFLVKIVYLENIMHKQEYYKGYIFSILICIVIAIILVVGIEFIIQISPLQILFLTLIVVGYSVLPLLYFILCLKTVGQTRRNAFKVAAGSIFLGLGLLFRPGILDGYIGITNLLDTLIYCTYITAPISLFLASFLIFDSMRHT